MALCLAREYAITHWRKLLTESSEDMGEGEREEGKEEGEGGEQREEEMPKERKVVK